LADMQRRLQALGDELNAWRTTAIICIVALALLIVLAIVMTRYSITKSATTSGMYPM
jgi:hypothetical protein